MICPNCKSQNIETGNKRQEFGYGEEGNRVTLVAEIPVRHCLSCDLKYEDAAAFEARHNAVCDHLGLLRPAMIRELRTRTYGTREAFAAATGIGTASLARWENAALLQSPAYDRYLRLLAHRDIRERLNIREDVRQARFEVQEAALAYEARSSSRFIARALTPEMTAKGRQSGNQFSLRGALRAAG
jgi:YgiT-type zinc finger domain-containing protein